MSDSNVKKYVQQFKKPKKDNSHIVDKSKTTKCCGKCCCR